MDEAINYYKKGFIIKNDYYNGENYSNCLLLKTQKPDLEVDEIEYLKFESKKGMQRNYIVTRRKY